MKALLIGLAILTGASQDPGPWRLVYERDKKLWSVREDGTDVRAEAELPSDFVLSPDRKRRVYISPAEESKCLMVSAWDGSNPKALTPEMKDSSCASPQWTPDGKRIVFAHTQGAKWQIWIVDADGSNLSRLTDHEAGARGPQVSPAGDRIAYLEFIPAREKLPPTSLRTIDLTGREPKMVIEKTQILGHAWSPKGDRLAVSLVQEMRILEMPTGKTLQSFDYATIDKKLYAHAAYGMTWRPDSGAIACTIQFLGGRMLGTKVFGDEQIFILPFEGKPVILKPGGPAGPVRWTR